MESGFKNIFCAFRTTDFYGLSLDSRDDFMYLEVLILWFCNLKERFVYFELFLLWLAIRKILYIISLRLYNIVPIYAHLYE